MNSSAIDVTSATQEAPDATIALASTAIPQQQLWLRLRQSGDMAARETLLLQYAYLVRFVIGRMKVRLVPTLDYEDLQSAGAIGLIKAVDRFDLNHGVKFETYAYRWIEGHILDYVRHLDVLSRTSRDRVKKFKAMYRQLRETLGRDPQEGELREGLKMTQDEINVVYFEMGNTEVISLQTAFHGSDFEDDGDSREESWKDETERSTLSKMEQKELLSSLQGAIDQLPDRERQVISLYYFEELTLKEIGDVLGVSESRVCQIHSKAVLDLQMRLEKASL